MKKQNIFTRIASRPGRYVFVMFSIWLCGAMFSPVFYLGAANVVGIELFSYLFISFFFGYSFAYLFGFFQEWKYNGVIHGKMSFVAMLISGFIVVNLVFALIGRVFFW